MRPPIKTHGGKNYLAPWIVSYFPPHYEDLTYVEGFVGGGSVLLRKRQSLREIIADKDHKIIALWNCLKYKSQEMIVELGKWPYSQESMELASLALQSKVTSEFNIAIAEYVVRRMSRGGLRKAFAWSERLRGGKPGDLNAWETSLDNISPVAGRVQKVEIFCLDFQETLENWNGSNVLLYLDPPYLKSTRAKGCTEAYDFEISDDDHSRLIELCCKSKSNIIISGYDSSLYSEGFKGWKTVYKDVANNASQSKTKSIKRETLWYNY